MLSVIISWLVLFIILLAFGEMATSMWNKLTKKKDIYSITDKIWIGLCTVGIIALYLSIFIPLNIWTLASIGLLSATYIGWNREKFACHLNAIVTALHKIPLPAKLLLTALFVIAIAFTVAAPYLYDQWLYHMQAMQWTESFKAVVGLGNLHGRLAFNSSFLLLSTLFNYHPDSYLVFFSINGFCIFIFSVWLLNLSLKESNILKRIILLFSLFSVIYLIGKSVSSTSTDVLPNVLVIYILIRLITNKKELFYKPLLFVLIPVFCITLKLSSVVIVLIAATYIIALFFRGEKKTALILTLLGAIVVTPWLIRFIILSGFLVYPFPAIDIFTVDWKMPADMVLAEKNAAHTWARAQTITFLSFGEWFPIWWRNQLSFLLGLYILGFLSPLLMFVLRKNSKTLVWLVAYIGLVFGFVNAPDFRFTYGFIICAVVIPFYILASKINLKKRLSDILYYLTIAAFFGLTIIAIRHVAFFQDKSKECALNLIVKPQPLDLQTKKIEFEEYQINNTTIFVPIKTDQCFDQFIPCAPYYNVNLEMRGNAIENGFRIRR